MTQQAQSIPPHQPNAPERIQELEARISQLRTVLLLLLASIEHGSHWDRDPRQVSQECHDIQRLVGI